MKMRTQFLVLDNPHKYGSVAHSAFRSNLAATYALLEPWLLVQIDPMAPLMYEYPLKLTLYTRIQVFFANIKRKKLRDAVSYKQAQYWAATSSRNNAALNRNPSKETN